MAKIFKRAGSEFRIVFWGGGCILKSTHQCWEWCILSLCLVPGRNLPEPGTAQTHRGMLAIKYGRQ